ncbi:lipopolysaccharide-induced tumor necrosis factor-alpha factor homolog [Achroia grisella]|uniref:lipopolysaccharide-induced tumor necrosis factor-alpha factor homolog n=1 Tax=Achroia grisella TaxID=688607 RepID=UPI0027D24C9E|nr:lipopolysaccharide-induced tumor necrosis factor-alpha factor homolog [Achroia grisella]
MDDNAVPLYPQVYPSAQITKKMDNSAPVLLTSQPSPNPLPVPTLVGPDNSYTVCQFCHASIKTSVRYTVTTRTHISAALCCIACCCCCIPYLSESAKNTDHYCPNCHKYLGTYEK